jgi:hypothetical protein
MFARIEGTTVAEVWDRETLPDLHPALAIKYVECTPDVRPGWSWDGTTFSAPPGPTLDDIKAAKMREIDAERDRRLFGGFAHTVGGAEYRFDSDRKSESNILGARVAAMDGLWVDGSTWRTEDNQNVPVTAADVAGLAAALLVHTQTQYQIAWALKDAVSAATNEAEVAAIVWPE